MEIHIVRHRILLIITVLVICTSAHAISMLGRTGLGFTNQLQNDYSALSFKIQKSRNSALGVLLGIKSDSNDTNYAIGLKAFRLIYDEPLLNFYMSALGAYMTNNTTTSDDSGFQIDGTLGTEFFFSGLESIGFSLEFGLSLHKSNGNTTFETVGYDVIKAAVHFYL